MPSKVEISDRLARWLQSARLLLTPKPFREAMKIVMDRQGPTPLNDQVAHMVDTIASLIPKSIRRLLLTTKERELYADVSRWSQERDQRRQRVRQIATDAYQVATSNNGLPRPLARRQRIVLPVTLPGGSRLYPPGGGMPTAELNRMRVLPGVRGVHHVWPPATDQPSVPIVEPGIDL
jgi:hypothetical protein